jgi:hypothetical protein
MKYRALQAKGVWLGAVAIDGDSIAIGALILKERKGSVTLKDVDSDRTITIDLSQIAIGTSYKVVLKNNVAI